MSLLRCIENLSNSLLRKNSPAALHSLVSFSRLLSALTDLVEQDGNIKDAHVYAKMADTILSEVLDLDEDFGPALERQGILLVDRTNERENLETACDLFERAHKNSQVEPDLMTFWAKALHELGRYEEAFQKATLALKIQPNNFDAYVIRSHYQHLKKLQRQPHYKRRGRPPKGSDS